MRASQSTTSSYESGVALYEPSGSRLTANCPIFSRIGMFPGELLLEIFTTAAEGSIHDALSLCLVASWIRAAILPVIYSSVVLPQGPDKFFIAHQAAEISSLKSALGHVKSINSAQLIQPSMRPDISPRSAVRRTIIQCRNLERVLLVPRMLWRLHPLTSDDMSDPNILHPVGIRKLRLAVLGNLHQFSGHFASMQANPSGPPIVAVTHLHVCDTTKSLNISAWRQIWPSLQHLAVPIVEYGNSLQVDHLCAYLQGAVGMTQVVLILTQHNEALEGRNALQEVCRRHPFLSITWCSQATERRISFRAPNRFEKDMMDRWFLEVDGGPTIWESAKTDTTRWVLDAQN